MTERAVAPRFTIRRLTIEDADAYQAVRLAGLRDHPEQFGAARAQEALMTSEEVRARLERNAVFGAIVDEALAGIAGLMIGEGDKVLHKGHLWGMYVRPAARGSGAARALVRAVLDEAATRVEHVTLGVVPDNVPARRLYEGLGFVAYGLEPRAYKVDGRYIQDLLMWRPVDGGA